jgi:hypothetical protein
LDGVQLQLRYLLRRCRARQLRSTFFDKVGNPARHIRSKRLGAHIAVNPVGIKTVTGCFCKCLPMRQIPAYEEIAQLPHRTLSYCVADIVIVVHHLAPRISQALVDFKREAGAWSS